jgi:hypothetical protein
MRRRITLCATAALIAGMAGPALAQDLPPLVGVHQGSNGTVCVAVSYQTEHCTPSATTAK